MSVRIACPGCGREAFVEELSLGRRGRCKQCGHVFALVHPGGGSGSGSSQAAPASAWKGEAPPAPAPAFDLPEQFGRYRIMRRLAMGGMGAVYLAQDVRLGRSVALKVPFFHPSEGAAAIGRFEREARAAATLDHPNLCPVYDVGEIDGIHYLTMPFLEGKPLSEAMPRGRAIPEAQAAAVVRKLALALAEAHAKGVIHRDLKPGNIMVSRRRELVIMDFGLARLAGSDAPLTVAGHVLGTALYMAPEQAAGDVEATGPPCDVYSLGVILYELLTGVRPFEGPWSMVIGLKSVRDPEPPSAHRPGLDPRLDAVCRKAIARDPADRFQTMAEFAAQLEGDFSPVPAPPSESSLAEQDEAEVEDDVAARMLADLIRREGTTNLGGRSTVQPAGLLPKAGRWGLSVRGRIAILVGIGLAIGVLLATFTDVIPAGRDADELPDRPGNLRQDLESTKAPAEPEKAKVVDLPKPSGADAKQPDPLIPPDHRKANIFRGDGAWTIEGEDLVLTGGDDEQGLVFGEPTWADYCFEFDVKYEGRSSGVRSFYHYQDKYTFMMYTFGINLSGADYGPNTALIEINHDRTHYGYSSDKKERLVRKIASPILVPDRWYHMKVEVAGKLVKTYFDGKLIFEYKNEKFDRGQVGVGAWYRKSEKSPMIARFRNFLVTAPYGTILWKGLPELGPE